MKEHTPGPWKWLHEEINAKHKKGTRRKANQMVFCLKGNTDRPHAMDHHDFTTVMELHWYDVKGTSIINASPREEDARLISAAPELLAACKLVRRSDFADDEVSTWEAIQAAIRKAEGGAD